MSSIFARFRRKRSAKHAQKHTRAIDRPLIGSERYEGKPVSAREYLMPVRKALQEQYRSEGRDPESLSRIPASQRDERFWVTYIDSLTVFEEDQKALTSVTDALARYPRNRQLLELKFLMEKRME